MTTRLAVLAACAVVFSFRPSPSRAGPDWVEETDAGSLPGGAQVPKGEGTLAGISGSLHTLVAAGRAADMEDMYAIFITDPETFTAETVGDGSVTFDSQLWLFDADGRAVIANDDATAGLPGSRIAPPATDGTGQTIPGRGVYFLAISGFDNDPTDESGSLLFDQALRIEVSGPDGPGGSLPVGGWGRSEESGKYLIALTGAAFPPGDCDGDGIFDPDDDDIDGDEILNVDDTCDYTPHSARSLVTREATHPLYGSLACDMDGDCDCDLDDFARFERLFTGVGCADGRVVTESACPVVREGQGE